MARPLPIRARVALIVTTIGVSMSVLAPAAQAACAKTERAQIAAARTFAAQTPEGVARTDAAALAASALRRCSSARFAYAATAAARAVPAPAAGTRMRSAGIDLIATATPTGVFWRLDVNRASSRLIRAKGARAQALLRAWTFPARTKAGTFWSPDPTRPTWDPSLQSLAIGNLSRSRSIADRALAAHGVIAYTAASRQRSVAAVPVLDHLLIASRLVRAATGSSGVRASKGVTSSAYRRVAKAAAPSGWSQLAGTWSTVAQHKALITRTRALLRSVPNARTTKVVVRLAGQLKQPADVRFKALPSGAFYPWPRDGAHDTQTMHFNVDKPGTIRVEIYGAAGDQPLRVLEQAVAPGDIAVTWDGAADDGAIQEPGDYPYVVVTDDIGGHRSRVPGLAPFQIAKDTTAPVVTNTAVAFVSDAKDGPKLVATWSVNEPLSPFVKTQLTLKRGAKSINIVLADRETAATVRRALRLGVGTWSATFTFTDGSGNVTTDAATTFVVK